MAKIECNKLYSSEPFTYECPGVGSSTHITALWWLDVDQGSEGFLSPMSDKVVCSVAHSCRVLAAGACPLTVGYGQVLNAMSVCVLQNEPLYYVSEKDGQILPFGDPRPDGAVIWFGRIEVLSALPKMSG